MALCKSVEDTKLSARELLLLCWSSVESTVSDRPTVPFAKPVRADSTAAASSRVLALASASLSLSPRLCLLGGDALPLIDVELRFPVRVASGSDEPLGEESPE